MDESSITELKGQVNTLGSPEVSDHFHSSMSALKDQNKEKVSLEHQALRKLISDELWNCPKGSIRMLGFYLQQEVKQSSQTSVCLHPGRQGGLNGSDSG